MHISEVFDCCRITFSFEFFPPKSEAASHQLFENIRELVPLKPAFVSVTYGAGGSTRDLTHDLVTRIQSEIQLNVVSHLTCVGSTKDEIFSILKGYRESGICNIMALRGDPPEGEKRFVAPEGGFSYAAELVAFIKKEFPKMGIGVAGYPEGHPETPNRLREIELLKAKVDAGADYICTQMFFDNNDFYDFRERCIIAGINVPIIAGIMPITSLNNMKRMADLALGMRYPAKLLKAVARAEDNSYVEKVGIHWASEQVRDLVDNDVRGIHFYTLNKSGATRHIYESLGVSSSLGFNK
ncbi:MAG TPA: methylenetetrahydrofolate reductase [NAD(P)H] [Spirochaetota bacterium]|nr:methylenetetrahydrofolate reductase [NAD(P)H] [Spirochaetota bacterium]HPJ39487.1 methylenetetrahydrofolate reductase [NAD(P)H] [Spirochaetota bacterium]HPQ51736.1 methylenetetrahydrofolate reductase [NAD(P)H] [Spirochaetota bacterium]